jgi:hypothetical protein
MTQTEHAIGNLADIFAKHGKLPFSTCVRSLESLVRLAIADHVAAPIRAAQADMDKVDQIRVNSALK